MMEDIERFAGVRLGPGTLYGAITRLEERGLDCARRTKETAASHIPSPAPAGSIFGDQLTSLGRIARTGLRRLENS